jgi:MerR family transcriptional regulator, redox-sensitive transcriptional activator SoxR
MSKIAAADIGKALTELSDGRTPNAHDWKRLSAHWRHDLNERIQSLTQLRDQLDGCIGCGCLSINACRLRNPLDELSEDGPGPRLLKPD